MKNKFFPAPEVEQIGQDLSKIDAMMASGKEGA